MAKRVYLVSHNDHFDEETQGGDGAGFEIAVIAESAGEAVSLAILGRSDIADQCEITVRGLETIGLANLKLVQ